MSLARVLAALVAVAVSSLVGAAPAHAADRLQVSRDGVVWGDTWSQPLFDPSLRWVPGDDRAVSAWVRNAAGDGGDLAIRVVVRGEAISLGDLELLARADGGPWRALGPAGSGTDLVRLAAGEQARVDVRGRFRSEAGNDTQLQTVPLSFRVTLVDASAGAATDDPVAGDPVAGDLADTGATAGLGRLALAAVLLLVLGLMLLAGSRRRNERETDV